MTTRVENLEKVDPGHPDFPLHLDHTRDLFITAWGRKGSGKSVFNRLIYKSWPGDKLCIDVNGNAEPGPDAERLSTPLPKAFPERAPALGEPRRPRNLWYRAHPGSDTYRDDLDRAVRVALYPQAHKVLLWAGEVGELQANGRPKAHMRSLLMQNRHYNVTVLADGPRPVYVDPLTLSQSNLVAVYELPNPRDRARIADEIGIAVKDFERVCFDTWNKGDHWFVLYNADHRRTLFTCPPLPLDQVDEGKAA